MSTLHILARGPSAGSPLTRCLQSMNPGDALLLIDDAVRAAIPGEHGGAALGEPGPGFAIYALMPSLVERGLSGTQLIAGVGLIDFDGFVDLTTNFETSISWT